MTLFNSAVDSTYSQNAANNSFLILVGPSIIRMFEKNVDTGLLYPLLRMLTKPSINISDK